LSLNQREFRYQIGHFVKCWTEDEFESLRRIYDVKFQKVTEPNLRKSWDRTLAKASLGYTEGWFVIAEDGARWNAVSMLKRSHSRMPSTTNTLEATHGHRNDIVTRRNSFWQSLIILVDSIADETIGFEARLAHDFRASLKRSKRCGQLVSPDRMAEEHAFFGTSRDGRGCVETVHLSSSYRADVPCSHRYSLETHKPDIPDGMGIQLHASIETLDYSETVHDRTGEVVNRDIPWLKMYAPRQIKRFSHSADKDVIGQHVGEHFDPRASRRWIFHWWCTS
jgi:hypothetical protein